MGSLGQYDLVREGALFLAHWPYWAPLALVLLSVSGRFGRSFGVPNLFRDDDQIFNPEARWGAEPAAKARPPAFVRIPDPIWRIGASPTLWGAFGFMAAVGLFWIAAHAPPLSVAAKDGLCFADAVTRRPCPTELFRTGATGGPYLAAALAVAAALFLFATNAALNRPRVDFTPVAAERKTGQFLRATLGLALGAGFVFAVYGFAASSYPEVGRLGALLYVSVPYLLLLLVVAGRPNALPAVSIASLVVTLILVGMPLSRLGGAWTPIWAFIALGAITWANGRFGKRQLPGFEALYEHPINPQEKPEKDAPPPPFPLPPLIDPVAALTAWRARTPDSSPKPILVLVATSGGAYRAAFWTGFVLDALAADSESDGRWPDLASNVRLVTGASGGMVAGAYFTALAARGQLGASIVDRISADTIARMGSKAGCDRNQPIARDSLSPVVHQLVRRDLPSLLLPWTPASDRGRALDGQWGTLDLTYAELAKAERSGAAPSLILSPMLVETGAVAIFSNLDLDRLRRTELDGKTPAVAPNKATVEVFKAFGDAYDKVSLATAVRLNASFPYVSPAISLPTRPDRRPVDAGYYDNYGIDLLTAYLEQDAVAAFVRDNCRGVAVIQIRAFPSGQLTELATRRQRAFHFLTSPVEGIFAARQASQMFRNDQQLAHARRRYGEVTGDEDFLRVFTFEANTDVSMSWYLRCDETRALAALVKPPRRSELQWGPFCPPDAAAGEPVENREEVERWVVEQYGEDAEKVSTPDAFVRALQAREPAALRAQQLHHRAKVADEFKELARFWRRQGPDPAQADMDPQATRHREREAELEVAAYSE